MGSPVSPLSVKSFNSQLSGNSIDVNRRAKSLVVKGLINDNDRIDEEPLPRLDLTQVLYAWRKPTLKRIKSPRSLRNNSLSLNKKKNFPKN